MAAMLVGLSASGAGAQSLFSAFGIGTPMDALDARAVALGGMGIGLMGGEMLPSDPAAAADIPFPTMTMTARPSWATFAGGPSGSGRYQETFFPLMGLAYPVPRLGVASITFGSVLDQHYQIQKTGQIALYDTTETVEDIFHSQGGVSAIRVGLARDIGRLVSLGVQYGRYTGSTRRTVIRTFPGDSVLTPYTTGGSWTYSGSLVSGGASVRLGGIARLAGSVTWSSKLKATPASDTSAAPGGTYSLPLEFRVGASALLVRGISVNAGLTHADWNVSGSSFKNGSAGSVTTGYGFGLEFTHAALFGKPVPVRLGYHRTELPFSLSGDGKPVEKALSAGFGLTFQKPNSSTAAGVDLSLERGTRQDASLAEHFWRADLTLRVVGF